jgi:hypothetical protein
MKPNNPPAFPRPGFDIDTRGYSGDALREKMAMLNEPQTGMTLRDYFAAKMLPAISELVDTIDEAARDAYRYADAMLEARGKRV